MKLQFQKSVFLAFFIPVFILPQSWAQSPSKWKTPLDEALHNCKELRGDLDAPLKIDSCSFLIDQPNLPTQTYGMAYLERGLALLGSTQGASGRLDKAISDFSAAIAHQTDTTVSKATAGRGYYYRAQAYVMKGEAHKAISDYNEAIRRGAQNDQELYKPDIHRKIAELYARLGDYAKAIAAYSEAINENPKSEEVWLGRGQIFLQQGIPAKAIPDFDQAINLNSSNPDAYHARGFAYQMAGDAKRAIADYDKVLGKIIFKKENKMAYLRRGLAYAQLGQVEPALTDLDEAIKTFPDLAEAYNYRAQIHLQQQRNIDQALADYNKVISLDPASATAFYGRAAVRLKRGEFAKALEDYEFLVKKAPDNAAVLFGRGIARLRIGQTQAGNADLAKSRSLDRGPEAEFAKLGIVP